MANHEGSPHENNSPDFKVPICHATGSESNPYENGVGGIPKWQITAPDGHGGDAANHPGDIIPAFAAGSHGSQEWPAFGGRNLHLLALLENGCEPLSVTPSVAPSDLCGTVNDTVVVTADPTKFTYVVSGSRATGFSVDFTALTGFTISGDDPRVIPASAFTDVPCPITAVAPTVDDSEACDVEGTYTVPATAGVQYLLDGVPIAAGTYEGPESGTVTAQAVAPATLTNPAFSFALDLDPAEACEVLGVDEEEPKKPKPPKEPVDEPEVLGSEAAVPTTVDAGLLGPTGADSSPNGLLGAALVAGGLLMLSYAGLVTRGRSRRGAHQF